MSPHGARACGEGAPGSPVEKVWKDTVLSSGSAAVSPGDPASCPRPRPRASQQAQTARSRRFSGISPIRLSGSFTLVLSVSRFPGFVPVITPTE